MTDKDITTTSKFEDASTMDKKIPRHLLMKYQGNWYILKAGLEWKANLLFGGGNYGVTTEIIAHDRGEYALAKATFVTKDGMTFSNYGEASKTNVTPNMHKYLLHLAITRAECRVLRMATACGYTSVEEMDIVSTVDKMIPESTTDNEPPTAAQLKTLKSLKYEGEAPTTQKEAKELVAGLVTKK